VSTKVCSGLTFGDYNVENMSPTGATHIAQAAAHIANFMQFPDILFVQEIQDNSGPTDNGVTAANTTLTNLINAIAALGSFTYNSTSIDPVNDQDGGEPGGNIRQAYLYNPNVVRLRNPNPGNSTQANEVISTSSGPELKYNPGRIDPNNFAAWNSSRKPLVAAWETLDGKNKFFTVNVHFASKGGSSSLEGDLRPPINGVIDARIIQANVTGSFIAQILAVDKSAKVIAAGDFNEFTFVEPLEVFANVSGLQDLDVLFRVPTVERYTYLFDMSNQQLDHMYASRGVHSTGGGYEHIHVNSWADTATEVSDHDPSVAKLDVCQ
jgi:predicted extracellular nuclease